VFAKLKAKIIKFFTPVVEFFSFNAEVRHLVEILNQRIEHYQEVAIHIPSHPSGYTREIHKRRLSIAEAYIKIVRALDSELYEERLKALETLISQSFHAKTTGMPLNTARVQIALMKEAVKSVDNRRRQMELVSDFTLASFGQETFIRHLLKELNLIPVPELGKPLSELNMGWDGHVHDNLSEGRKTPSQVLIDAFIKGISEVTLAYFDLFDPRIIIEALRAGEILGIKVNLGIEFSVGESGARRHYMFIPGGCRTVEDYLKFFQTHKEALKPFTEGLKANAQNRRNTIDAMLASFNATHLKEINEGFEEVPFLSLPPLTSEALHNFVLQNQANRMHLGELLYHKLKPILFNRTLWLLNQYEIARQRCKDKELTPWELKIISDQYEKVRQEYENLTPEGLRLKYLYDPKIVDYNSAFASEEEIFPILDACGGELIYIHPLEAGLQTAVKSLIMNAPYLTQVEVFNMRDSVKRDPTDIRILNTLVYLLNNQKLTRIKEELINLGIKEIPDDKLEQALQYYKAKPLLPRCGSDSTGRDPQIPGMGFVELNKLPPPVARYFKHTHTLLPQPIADMIATRGKEEEAFPSSAIVSLGKIGVFKKNPVGDEKFFTAIDPIRFWRYLNPTLKSLIKMGVGFIPAYLTVGPEFALIWFSITFTRNVLVDLISISGLELKDWSWRGVNFDNLTSSLFWTGFSVPILATVKQGFDLFCAPYLVFSGTLFKDLVKFFFICFANGAYIATHNRIRGFARPVIRANFFRSVLAWPFATLFAPLGDYLHILSIVQAKFWSDFVAGWIEGVGKYVLRMSLRKRDIREILPNLYAPDRQTRAVAMLDILYLWAKSQRGDTMLKQVLTGKDTGLFSGLKQKLKEKASFKELLKFTLRREGVYPIEDVEFLKNYRRLKELFTEDGAVKSLNYVVLENYSGKEAYKLTALIAKHFIPFKDWLVRLKPAVEAAAKKRALRQE
jgi:hypothetical protein